MNYKNSKGYAGIYKNTKGYIAIYKYAKGHRRTKRFQKILEAYIHFLDYYYNQYSKIIKNNDSLEKYPEDNTLQFPLSQLPLRLPPTVINLPIYLYST